MFFIIIVCCLFVKNSLPIDGPSGVPVFAEVDIKGKKKEAVHQAALQACQILDKYGVLRVSHHGMV